MKLFKSLICILLLCFGLFGVGDLVSASCEQRAACEASCSNDAACQACLDIPCTDSELGKHRTKQDCLKNCQGSAEFCDCKCGGGTVLNTSIPFIGRCIDRNPSANGEGTTAGNAFARLLGGLMQVVMTAVIVVGFLAILIGGFMIASGGIKNERVSSGRGLIVKVIAGLALVGLSGVILNLINPNFFKTDTSGAIEKGYTMEDTKVIS